MKKIIMMMLVGIVPLLTTAQSADYMMIKGIEISMINKSTHAGEDIREMALGSNYSENVKLIIAFDYGNLRNKEVKEMMTAAKTGKFRTMISAVNAAAEKGWELINSNVISEDKMKIHYYYMKRNQ